jgi:hypothetical protein
MTNQELFSRVRAHLLTQRKRSVGYIESKEVCMYRGTNGTKCAIGVLIPDDEYRVTMEGHTLAASQRVQYAAGIAKDQMNLASRLQQIHDNSFVDKWETELQNAAEDFALENV